MGGFNAYHYTWSKEHCSNPRKRAKGEILHELVQESELHTVNCFQPNFIRGTTENVNDLIFTNEVLMKGRTFCETREHLVGSDHLMIRMQFDCQMVYHFLNESGVNLPRDIYKDSLFQISDHESTSSASETS